MSMHLTPCQRAGLNSAAKHRVYMARTGETYSGDRIWTVPEINELRARYPDLVTLQSVLPGRTRKAIKRKADVLGIVRHRPLWSDAEKEAMPPRYRAGVPVRQIAEVLNRRTPRQIWSKASTLKIGRPRRRPRPVDVPAVHSIRQRAFDMRISLKDLDAATCGRGYFGKAPQGPRWHLVRRAVKVLGGHILVRWSSND